MKCFHVCWFANLVEGIFDRTSILLATMRFEFEDWFLVSIEIDVSNSRSNIRVFETNRNYA